MQSKVKILFFLLVLCASLDLHAADLNKYLIQLQYSYKHLIDNLNYPGINAGAVIASPSTRDPNYFYHWVRDAGLTMDEVVTTYALATDPKIKKFLFNQIWNWVLFESRIQETANPSRSLGEPKFNINGSAFWDGWGRPQNDGPAIRAIAMMRFAQILMQQNHGNLVKKLYKAELPATTPIKKDLEYVAHHWDEPCFDVWEETMGYHFFTMMAQRKAMVLGSKFALLMGDSGAAQFYNVQAKRIENAIQGYLNNETKTIIPTINSSNPGKASHLDSAVILAVLYFDTNDGFLNPTNPWVINTAKKLENVFKNIYELNNRADLGVAIGRYPEDVYNGNGFSSGNPWFITTNAFAELTCKIQKKRQLSVKKGLAFLDRSLYHIGVNGHMSEQFNRNNGYMQGARDLTWSYVSYIRAVRACLN